MAIWPAGGSCRFSAIAWSSWALGSSVAPSLPVVMAGSLPHYRLGRVLVLFGRCLKNEKWVVWCWSVWSGSIQ